MSQKLITSNTTMLSFKRHFYWVETQFRCILSNLSTGAEKAGMHKYTDTSLANEGHFISLAFQKK